jgi:hypothetical protein
MTRRFTAATPEPVLYVSLKECPADVTKSFETVRQLGMQRVVLVKERSRMLHFCRLTDY